MTRDSVAMLIRMVEINQPFAGPRENMIASPRRFAHDAMIVAVVAVHVVQLAVK